MSFSVPKRLVRSVTSQENTNPSSRRCSTKTVYTVRLTTSPNRYATHSDTSSGILLALVSESEESFLHFIPTTVLSSDASSTETMLRDMCAGGADDTPPGADCSLIMASPTPDESSYNRHRFLSGTTTEVSFVAPNLGPLSAVIVGPQSGTWGCSEVIVSSSADDGKMSSKFLSKDQSKILGEDPLHSASYMVRVPLGSIMYGEGPDAKILSASDAMEMAARNMTWYEEMKKRLLFYTASVGFVGTALVYGSMGAAEAIAFASGSAMSFAYQMGLQKKVDNIGSTTVAGKGSSIGGGGRSGTGENDLGVSLLTGALPFFAVGALAWFVYIHPDLLGMHTKKMDIGGNNNFSLLLALLAGFGCQKLALVLFSAVPGSRSGEKVLGQTSGAAQDGVGRRE